MHYKTFDISELTLHNNSEEEQIRTRKIFEILKQKADCQDFLIQFLSLSKFVAVIGLNDFPFE